MNNSLERIEEIKQLYISVSEARKELWKRWNDKDLREKVKNFLNGNIPYFLKDNPKAYLARYIFSPNFEAYKFLDLARKSGLRPICPEYINDKFLSRSKVKYYLGKMYFYDGKGKHGGAKISFINMINFNQSEGKKFKEIRTNSGKLLSEFHHELVNISGLSEYIDICDFSKWLINNGAIAEKYYVYFLALFVCHGILFENFISEKDEEESKFTKDIVLPSVNKIIEIFNVKPLVVQLLPFKEETNKYWFCYPEFLKRKIIINEQQSKNTAKNINFKSISISSN